MTILITGCAGFIGMHFAKMLLQRKFKVVGIDNMNRYYDINLKKDRIKILKKFKNFSFYSENINKLNKLKLIFKQQKPNIVINLAGQAGVRYSLTNPSAYIQSNIKGFFNM